MSKHVKIHLGALALIVVGCTSQKTKVTENEGYILRSPASLQDPPGMFLPGMPTPGGHVSPGGQDPKKFPEIPQGKMTEGLAACKLNLSAVAIGGSYSVGDALYSLRVNKTLRDGSMSRGTFTGTFELDRKFLSPWFAANDISENLEEMGRLVPAYKKALGFVFGPMTDCAGPNGVCTQEDFEMAHRMAVLLASAFAVGKDPECIRYVVDGVAPQVLGGNIGDFKTLPVLEISDKKRNGTLSKDFEITQKNKEKIDAEIYKVEKKIEAIMRADERSLKAVQREVREAFRELEIGFSQMPPCKRIIQEERRLLTEDDKDEEFFNKITKDCEDLIQKRLDDLASEEGRLRALPDDKNPNKEEKLTTNQEKAKMLKGFLDINDENSLPAKVEKMNALFKKRGELQKNPEYKTVLAEKETLNLRLKDMAPTYVTQGYINRLK